MNRIAIASFLLFLAAPALAQGLGSVSQTSTKSQSPKVGSMSHIPDGWGCGINGESANHESTHGSVSLYVSPNRYAGRPVARLKITDGGKATITSVGDMLSLRGLVLSEVEKLWGPSKDDASGAYRTIGLWGFWAVDKREKSIYQIDLKCVAGKLSSYRLRGLHISDPEWISVN